MQADATQNMHQGHIAVSMAKHLPAGLVVDEWKTNLEPVLGGQVDNQVEAVKGFIGEGPATVWLCLIDGLVLCMSKMIGACSGCSIKGASSLDVCAS
jgi:hypothetical protein